MEARRPADEQQRLAALRRYHVLDSEPEGAYDDITALAAWVCQVPVSLVSLVDEERQWFKSRHGIDAKETPRALSFCAHSINETEPFIVTDASQDPRFFDNPLVLGPPNIRFYAAAQLVSPDGFRLGTLCVLDWKPRNISPEQIEALRVLSRQVMTQLELRWNVHQLNAAVESLTNSERALESANRQLQSHVSERTIELQQANQALEKEFVERRKAEEVADLRQRQFLHAQKMESIGRLVSGVAHDFNNLLTATLGNTELAESQLAEDHPAHEYLHEIASVTRRAAQLTARLLAFARPHTGPPIQIDINAQLRSLMSVLRRILGERVRVTLKLATPMYTVNADPGQFEQVVLNLAVNARDAMPEGGSLSLRTRTINEAQQSEDGIRKGSYAIVEVQDTGIGMSPNVQAHIFEPFFTTKESDRGTGLGLATCEAVMRQLGGAIRVESCEGKGSTFRLYFPRSASVEASTERAPERTRIEADSKRRLSVLLVEDDPRVRTMAARILKAKGHQVREAADGASALALLTAEANTPQLLITDLVLPGMPGVELAKHARNLCPTVKVLFVSGYGDQHSPELCLRDPDAMFLAKPYSGTMLVRMVDALASSED